MMDLLYQASFLIMYQLMVMRHTDDITGEVANRSLFIVFLVWLLSYGFDVWTLQYSNKNAVFL